METNGLRTRCHRIERYDVNRPTSEPLAVPVQPRILALNLENTDVPPFLHQMDSKQASTIPS